LLVPGNYWYLNIIGQQHVIVHYVLALHAVKWLCIFEPCGTAEIILLYCTGLHRKNGLFATVG